MTNQGRLLGAAAKWVRAGFHLLDRSVASKNSMMTRQLRWFASNKSASLVVAASLVMPAIAIWWPVATPTKAILAYEAPAAVIDGSPGVRSGGGGALAPGQRRRVQQPAIETLAVIYERPLFWRGREPLPTGPSSVSDQSSAVSSPAGRPDAGSPPPEPGLSEARMVGFFGDQQTLRAVIKVEPRQEAVHVQAGATVGDWKVLSVTTDTVTLEGRGLKTELPLFSGARTSLGHGAAMGSGRP